MILISMFVSLCRGKYNKAFSKIKYFVFNTKHEPNQKNKPFHGNMGGFLLFNSLAI